MAQVLIEINDSAGRLVTQLARFKKIILRAPFGAMQAKCFVFLLDQDRSVSISHGDECRVRIDGTLKFLGKVETIQRRSLGDELSFLATRDPGSSHTESVSGLYVNQPPTQVLQDFTSQLSASPLTYSDDYPSSDLIDRLEFTNYDLFYGVDLLAKLAGNYLWDVQWDNRLRFRPKTLSADHSLHYDPRTMAINLWKTTDLVKNFVELFGGVTEGNQFYRIFSDPGSIALYGTLRESLFVRPVSTQGAYEYLEAAVREQLPLPVYQKYVDLFQPNPSIGFGDTLQLLNTSIQGLDEAQLYRVKMEELLVDSEGEIKTRLHLAQLYESSSRFLRYLDHTKGEPDASYADRRLGSFKLDYSVLDSQAHLD